MAWIYLAELAEEHLLWRPGSDQSPIAKATSPRKASYLNSNKKERSLLRQFGTTYEPSSDDTSPSLWMGFNDFSWSSMRWGLMRAGLLFQPKRWEPRISENDSGSLPTPTASE